MRAKSTLDWLQSNNISCIHCCCHAVVQSLTILSALREMERVTETR